MTIPTSTARYPNKYHRLRQHSTPTLQAIKIHSPALVQVEQGLYAFRQARDEQIGQAVTAIVAGGGAISLAPAATPAIGAGSVKRICT